jgi:Uma2 family endonuclease
MNARVFIPVDKAAFYRFIATEPEGRYEFEGGRIVQQMTGGTLRHGRIATRMLRTIEDQIVGTSWQVTLERGVDTPKTIRYGDVVMEPVTSDPASLSTREPALIVEVLSPSTIRTDLDVKSVEYLSLSSLQAYIVASQTDAACLAWIRGADGAFGAAPVEHAAGEVIAIPSLGVSILVADIYAGIDISTQDNPTQDNPTHG